MGPIVLPALDFDDVADQLRIDVAGRWVGQIAINRNARNSNPFSGLVMLSGIQL